MTTQREALVFRAKIAEQAECFEEMVAVMKQVSNEHHDLTVEERNLLSIGYKNVIGEKRTAWRIVSALEDKQKSKDPESWKGEQFAVLRGTIEKELHGIVEDILQLLNPLIENRSADAETGVFWLKMKGDYFRYIAEFERGEAKDDAKTKAFDAYTKALEIGTPLDKTNPLLLGLALNFSVFHYEIMNDRDKACEMARTYYDDAIADLDKLPKDDYYRDITLIMQLLRDNLSLWMASDSDEYDDDSDY
jgi:14-3-3 protein epsilon